MGAATGVEGSTEPSSLRGSKTYRLDRPATETVQMLNRLPSALSVSDRKGFLSGVLDATGQVNVGGKVR
jgi:hypothetical protein